MIVLGKYKLKHFAAVFMLSKIYHQSNFTKTICDPEYLETCYEDSSPKPEVTRTGLYRLGLEQVDWWMYPERINSALKR